MDPLHPPAKGTPAELTMAAEIERDTLGLLRQAGVDPTEDDVRTARRYAELMAARLDTRADGSADESAERRELIGRLAARVAR